MASMNTAPSSWEESDVEVWGCRVKLSDETVATLVGNQVDGPALVALQQEELKLGILFLLFLLYLFFEVVTTFIQNRVNISEVPHGGHIRLINRGRERERGIVSEEEMEDKADALESLPKISRCNVCYTERISGFSLACDHAYCTDCMKNLFKTALKDTSLLPLRCCAIPIDMNVSGMLLEEEETGVLELRLGEIEATSKMHCTTCSRFINLDLVDSSESTELLCSCGTLLCTSCKTGSHNELSCIENKAATTGSDDLLFEISRTEGWKQCPGCEIMIELEHGCNHMTCANCIHEFCFKCLRPWQGDLCSSGRCEVWDEDRLVAAGERRVQAHDAAQREARAALARRAQHVRAAGERRVQQAHEITQREVTAELARGVQRARNARKSRVQAEQAAQREARAVLVRRAQRAKTDGEKRVQAQQAAQREARAVLARRDQRAKADGEKRVQAQQAARREARAV
jgi:hypothetical protein